MTNQPEGQHPVPEAAIERLKKTWEESAFRNSGNEDAVARDLYRCVEADLQKRLGEALLGEEAFRAAVSAAFVPPVSADRQDDMRSALRAAWDAATGHSFSLEEEK